MFYSAMAHSWRPFYLLTILRLRKCYQKKKTIILAHHQIANKSMFTLLTAVIVLRFPFWQFAAKFNTNFNNKNSIENCFFFILLLLYTHTSIRIHAKCACVRTPHAHERNAPRPQSHAHTSTVIRPKIYFIWSTFSFTMFTISIEIAFRPANVNFNVAVLCSNAVSALSCSRRIVPQKYCG